VRLTVGRSPRLAERQPDVLVVDELEHRLDLLAGLVKQLLGHGSDGRVLARVRHRRRRTAVVQELQYSRPSSRVVSVLDSGAEGPGVKSQSRRCRVTVLGKLFTPVVPLFTKQ